MVLLCLLRHNRNTVFKPQTKLIMLKRLLKSGTTKTIFVMLTLICFCRAGYAQTVTAQGFVRDGKGILPGASVYVKGSSVSTMAGADGSYKISVTPQAVLVFTFVGYTPREINLKDYQPNKGVYKIDVELTGVDNNLNEVVVVGFGTQKRVDLTSAVSTISGKELEGRPVQNAVQSLEGKVPGLNISQNNGALDGTPSINIRGVGTIGAGSSAAPLLLIDGMDAGSGGLSAINPADIDNISVLKDASASALYGSRAAFGVILVTTKKGKVGATRVNYTNNFKFTSPVSLPKEMDAYTFALYFNEAEVNGGSAPFFDADHLKRIQDYMAGRITATDIPSPTNPSQWADGYAYGNDNIDWFKASFKSRAFSQEHNLSVNGGTDKVTYYLSGNYLGQNGLLSFNQDLYNRYSIAAKINLKVSDIFRINYSSRTIREETQRPSAFGNGFYSDLGRQGWPTLPLYDPNGYYFSSPSFALGLAQGGLAKVQRDNAYQQVQFQLEPVKNWVTNAEVNYRSMNHFDHTDNLQTYNHDVNGNPVIYGTGSSVSEYAYKENFLNINIYSTYSRTIAQKHNIKVTLGGQSESSMLRDVNASRQGIIVPDLPTINTTSGSNYQGTAVPPTVSGQYQDWSTLGYFARLNYDFDGKYLLEASGRYDAASRYRPGKRWAFFPSVSAGWNVAKEDFFQNVLKVVNTFKFRGSYGSLGNENTTTNGAYPTYVVLPVGTANSGWLIKGAQQNTASAPPLISQTLTWETVRTVDAGIDVGFFNNRLTGSFDWFNRTNINMLGPGVELPVTLGAGVPSTNNTNLKTYGFDLEIGWTDRLKNGLGYSMSLTLADNQTVVTRYANPTNALNKYIPGQKLGDIWGYTTIGIAKTQAEMDAHLATSSNGQNFFGSQWSAGDIMYADYNHDGKIDAGANTLDDPGDRHVIGNTNPRYMFGYTLNLDYKGFDFSAFLQGVLKRDFWAGGTATNNYFFWGATSDQWWSAGLQGIQLNYFRPDANDPLGQNLNAYFPRPIFGTDKNHQVQTAYLLNAAYLRVKNLQLGYSLPSALTRRVKIEKVRLYVSGDNLFTFTKMPSMFDPETVDGGVGGRGQGNVYPLTKVISFGANITF